MSMFIIPTQAQTIWQIIRSGMGLWKSSFKYAWPFSASLATCNLLYQYAYSGNTDNALLCSGLLLPLLMLSALFGSLIIDTMHRNRGQQSYQPLVVSRVLKKAWVLFMVGICTRLMLFFGMLCLLIPGILLWIYCLFAPYIAVIDGQGIFASIRRSFALVSKHWWFLCLRVIALQSLILLCALLVCLIFVGVFWMVKSSIPSITDHRLFLKGILWAVGWCFFTFALPVVDAFYLEMLYDLRLRKKIKA